MWNRAISARGIGRADVARRVRDSLRDEIQADHFKGGLLPSEAALMVQEEASRTAVRMALDLLRAEGLVARLQGRGTLVVDRDPVHVPLDPPRSVLSICGGAHRVEYRKLSMVATAVSPSVTERLELSAHDKVLFLERLTLVEGQPFSIGTVWFPLAVATPVAEGRVDLQQGVFDILERGLGLELGVSEYCVQAAAADDVVSALLDVPPASPLLLLGTLTRLTDGRPVALGHTRGRGDRVRYEFRADRAGEAFERSGC